MREEGRENSKVGVMLSIPSSSLGKNGGLRKELFVDAKGAASWLWEMHFFSLGMALFLTGLKSISRLRKMQLEPFYFESLICRKGVSTIPFDFCCVVE